MDPFQARLQFIQLLKRLNASLPTIQAALNHLVTHAPALHADLWSCIIDECKSGSINRRINLLFLIDAIFTDETLSPTIRTLFRIYLERDLYIIFDLAVPEDRWDALLNVSAVERIIGAWKSRFVLDAPSLEDLEMWLEVRKASLYEMSDEKKGKTLLSANEMQRRIEEDRERHKRLRERSWILPATAFSHQSLFGIRPEQLDPTYLTRMPAVQGGGEGGHRKDEDGGKEDGDRVWTTQDLDFSQMWEETSDFNDDDVEAILEDEKLGWENQPPPLPEKAVMLTPMQATLTAQVQQQQQQPQPPSVPMANSTAVTREPPRMPASMRLAQRGLQ
ncbi:uncharacterized protein MEPE_00480 [Melanopsichium pennsylvanicum]|uniref:CID domain-containing protein n=2 Tax=Melanopsichium pennsylvanicum TaxID=63383 RepID=A0AAJ4XGS1_9BASI|nr:conserved hypothetical protein [Melanopsichium pennsylvanicum 4]SNX81775.1 uncharacterized protein MEPE_00480 [Melanopsichium pennsylvanicum]